MADPECAVDPSRACPFVLSHAVERIVALETKFDLAQSRMAEVIGELKVTNASLLVVKSDLAAMLNKIVGGRIVAAALVSFGGFLGATAIAVWSKFH